MNKNIVFIIVLLALLVGLIWSSFTFGWEPLFKTRDEISGLQNERKILNQQLNKLKDLNEKYQELKKTNEAGKIDAALPSREEFAALIVNLEAIAGENGLFLESINFVGSGRSGNKDYRFLDIQLKMSGSYESLNSFARSLENNLRLVDLKLLKVGLEESVLKIEAISRAYYQ